MQSKMNISFKKCTNMMKQDYELKSSIFDSVQKN